MTEVLPETMVPVLDKGFLALDAALASDLAVVNGARVSFNQESDEMMSTFKSNHECILLAVQGGRFSEGEDFPGDDMAMSIVVGLPLPPPSPTMYANSALGWRSAIRSRRGNSTAAASCARTPRCTGRARAPSRPSARRRRG